MSTSRLLAGAALVLTAPFIPMLFQGEEWGASTPFLYFTNHDEPDLARAVSEGRKREFAAFGWDPARIPDPQDPLTFERSKLDWSELMREPHNRIFRWHQDLIRLRAQIPELRDGRLDRVEVCCDERERWLVMHRAPITVALNLSENPQQVPLDNLQGRRVLMTSAERIAIGTDGMELPTDSVAIIGPDDLSW